MVSGEGWLRGRSADAVDTDSEDGEWRRQLVTRAAMVPPGSVSDGNYTP